MKSRKGQYTIPIVVVILVFVIGYGIALYGSASEETIEVKNKWAKFHNNDAKYLISDMNNEVYSIEDTMWFLKFDASNRYAQIETNKTYKVKVVGWRIPLLSWYKNVIELEQIE